jgi:D-alanyl-lipoteichoic acid acyltransferase DltB (MBOAT superfamily)
MGCIILFFFKYLDFFSQSASDLLNVLKITSNLPIYKLFLPLGISFYTFQTLSYLIDVYRGDIKPERHFGYFAVYVSFFLTILSGPIERGTTLLPQLHSENKFDYNKATDGMKLVAWGLFKKVVIADRLAVYVNQVFNNAHDYTGWPLIIATFFFAFQLYCDFSGYTDMAIGCGKILGYDLRINFNLPYFSQSIKEFWRRWHISLSSWFKDYLYIPLGGNRVNKIRNYTNLILVFLVCGLWHGANWTFVIWGLIHGIYQVIGNYSKEYRGKIIKTLNINPDGSVWKIYKMLATFCLVDFAWLFFRANSMNDAVYFLGNIFKGLGDISLQTITLGQKSSFAIMSILILVLIFIEALDFRASNRIVISLKAKPYYQWVTTYILIMTILILGIFAGGQFIYTNF